MSDDERSERTGPTVSRRGIIRMAGGAALATAAITALRVGGPAAAAETVPAGRLGGQLGPDLRLAANGTNLLIPDGTPWWESADIWAVPGGDPFGPPGAPEAGNLAYVWARVTNTGKDDAAGVRVSFCWGNPSVQMRYSTINPIGIAYADIPAGQTREVLCPVPWSVVSVNDGHECLVVTAQLPGDPALPDMVDPPGYANVAQRNLTVVSIVVKGGFHLTVTANGFPRENKKVQITWETGKELSKATLASLGLKQSRPAATQAVEVLLSAKPDGNGGPTLDLDIPAGKSLPFYVTLGATAELKPDEYQVVRVVERQQNQILGGISFVAIGG